MILFLIFGALWIFTSQKDERILTANLRMTALVYGLGVCKRSCGFLSDALSGKPGIWI